MLLGHGRRRPQVLPAEVVSEVIQGPVTAVLDPGGQVAAQAGGEGVKLAAQVGHVTGRVHARTYTDSGQVTAGARPPAPE